MSSACVLDCCVATEFRPVLRVPRNIRRPLAETSVPVDALTALTGTPASFAVAGRPDSLLPQ